jgi:arylsulfatase A-like enzyme
MYIGAMAAMFPSFAVSQSVDVESRPNVILILADDMGVETVNAYGGEYATPNIDQLAREGMLFENAHATPLCTPSRTRLMTGIENAKNYKAFGYLDPRERTIAHMFKDAGYETGIVGKWQLSGNGFDGRVGITPKQAGFDEALLWQLESDATRGSRYWGPTLWENGSLRTHEWGFGPDLMNQFAIDFVKKSREKPFFLYYPMVLPHSPFVPTPETMHADGQKERFAGMIAYIDQLVGKLLIELEGQGQAKNTVVIFTGDNGTENTITSYRNGVVRVQGGKGEPILRGTHVPLIVRWPDRVEPGSIAEGLVDFTDFFPTLAELSGSQIADDKLDGFSQVPVMAGQTQEVRDSIFMHYAPVWMFKPARFVFDKNWKLYGDGKFVALDPKSGTELEIAVPEGAALKRQREFQKILDNAGDGPLDPVRFPMCVGKPSVRPGVSPEIGGCR